MALAISHPTAHMSHSSYGTLDLIRFLPIFLVPVTNKGFLIFSLIQPTYLLTNQNLDGLQFGVLEDQSLLKRINMFRMACSSEPTGQFILLIVHGPHGLGAVARCSVCVTLLHTHSAVVRQGFQISRGLKKPWQLQSVGVAKLQNL